MTSSVQGKKSLSLFDPFVYNLVNFLWHLCLILKLNLVDDKGVKVVKAKDGRFPTFF